MDYAQQQRNPGKHIKGIGIVLVMHAILGYALVNGLGKKIVEIAKHEVETKIIDAPPPPPPPPPENLPPPPKFAPPPPMFAPPPEVQVNQTPQPAAITAVTQAPVTTQSTAPIAIKADAPPPPPRVAARPAKFTANHPSCQPEYPAAAARAEATGTTRIRFAVDAHGKVTASSIEKSSGPTREHRLMDKAAQEALAKCPITAGVDENGKPVGTETVVEYVWKLD